VDRVNLLDNPPETVTVFPEETYVDSTGDTRTRPAAVGVPVRGWMQPMSTLRLFPSLDGTQQQRVYSTWRFIGRQAPLGVWSRVQWGDRSLTVRSGPEPRGYTPATAHVTALLQEER
jgi:hypothetical protein